MIRVLVPLPPGKGIIEVEMTDPGEFTQVAAWLDALIPFLLDLREVPDPLFPWQRPDPATPPEVKADGDGSTARMGDAGGVHAPDGLSSLPGTPARDHGSARLVGHPGPHEPVPPHGPNGPEREPLSPPARVDPFDPTTTPAAPYAKGGWSEWRGTSEWGGTDPDERESLTRSRHRTKLGVFANRRVKVCFLCAGIAREGHPPREGIKGTQCPTCHLILYPGSPEDDTLLIAIHARRHQTEGEGKLACTCEGEDKR